jgi:glycosyltransferase involved in cell wall biosynthesis
MSVSICADEALSSIRGTNVTRAGEHLVTLDASVPPSTARPSRVWRVLHFLGQCAPDTANGVERMAHDLTLAQARLGHHVARLLLETSASSERHIRQTRTERLIEPILDTAALATGRMIPDAAWNELRAWHPDIVHLHSLHVPENIALAALLQRAAIPYCVTVHGALAPDARRRGRLRKMLFHALYERAYLDNAAVIHALTSAERDAIQELGVRAPIAVAPNGVTLEGLDDVGRGALCEAVPEAAGRRVFMFIGRLDRTQKGLDLLIDAFADAALSDAVLVLVGPDWRGSRAQLERQVRERGIVSNVHFAGPVFGDAKVQFLSGADVFVHTSRWEGVSLSVLEAAAMRKACLLTTAADPSGALGRAGAAIVVAVDRTALASAVQRLGAMDDPELNEMGFRGRATVERQFSWPKVAQALVDMYGAGAVR